MFVVYRGSDKQKLQDQALFEVFLSLVQIYGFQEAVIEFARIIREDAEIKAKS